MQKFTTILLLALIFNQPMYSQPSSKDVLTEMSKMVDQYNKSFKSDQNQLTLIYVPGANSPFDKIYDRLKDKKLIQAGNVQFIGGFKETVAAMHTSIENAQGHIQEAMISRYGNKHFSILLDMESKIEQLLKLKGYAIITIQKKKDIVKIEQFEFDRLKFLDTLNATYFAK